MPPDVWSRRTAPIEISAGVTLDPAEIEESFVRAAGPGEIADGVDEDARRRAALDEACLERGPDAVLLDWTVQAFQRGGVRRRPDRVDRDHGPARIGQAGDQRRVEDEVGTRRAADGFGRAFAHPKGPPAIAAFRHALQNPHRGPILVRPLNFAPSPLVTQLMNPSNGKSRKGVFIGLGGAVAAVAAVAGYATLNGASPAIDPARLAPAGG